MDFTTKLISSLPIPVSKEEFSKPIAFWEPKISKLTLSLPGPVEILEVLTPTASPISS